MKHGVELSNVKLNLMYTKPATKFNKELNNKYTQNIFSVAEEIYAKDDERVDLVIFLNGLRLFRLSSNVMLLGKAMRTPLSNIEPIEILKLDCFIQGRLHRELCNGP